MHDDDEKETILYRFDGLSVSRNLRWLDDDDADSSLVDDEAATEKSETVKLPMLGIAELTLTEDSILINEAELGPESQSRFIHARLCSKLVLILFF